MGGEMLKWLFTLGWFGLLGVRGYFSLEKRPRDCGLQIAGTKA